MVLPIAVANAAPASFNLCLTSGSWRADETEPATWFQAPRSVSKASLTSSSDGPPSDATFR